MENKRKLAEPSNQAGDEHDDTSKKSKDYEDFLLDENLNTLSTKNLNTVTQIREVLDDATDHDTQVELNLEEVQWYAYNLQAMVLYFVKFLL